MALIKCGECGHDVSTKAESCPNCSAPPEQSDSQIKNFEGFELTQADFEKANLEGANFQNADLSWANFKEAILINANFLGANLWASNFEGADLSGANFFNSNLSWANLKESNNLTIDQISKAKTLYGTSLPSELHDHIGREFNHLLKVLEYQIDKDLDSQSAVKKKIKVRTETEPRVIKRFQAQITVKLDSPLKYDAGLLGASWDIRCKKGYNSVKPFRPPPQNPESTPRDTLWGDIKTKLIPGLGYAMDSYLFYMEQSDLELKLEYAPTSLNIDRPLAWKEGFDAVQPLDNVLIEEY